MGDAALVPVPPSNVGDLDDMDIMLVPDWPKPDEDDLLAPDNWSDLEPEPRDEQRDGPIIEEVVEEWPEDEHDEGPKVKDPVEEPVVKEPAQVVEEQIVDEGPLVNKKAKKR